MGPLLCGGGGGGWVGGSRRGCKLRECLCSEASVTAEVLSPYPQLADWYAALCVCEREWE